MEDHECDAKSDDRVGDGEPQRDNGGGGDDGEGDVRIGAGVVAVADQRGPVEALVGAKRMSCACAVQGVVADRGTEERARGEV